MEGLKNGIFFTRLNMDMPSSPYVSYDDIRFF